MKLLRKTKKTLIELPVESDVYGIYASGGYNVQNALFPVPNASPRFQKMNIVNEPGLYRLIFASKKPNAKAFQRKVYHEILPSIRKKGYYVAPNAKMPTDTFQPQIDELKETVAALEIIYREVMEGKLSALECADKLVAVAKDIQNPDSKDKVLLQAANFIIGKKIF